MTVINTDCVAGLAAFPDNTFDSVVTDPPYELGFMGKSWDASGIAYSLPMWREVLRVLKPGGHMLAFSGSRTYHRMACAIDDAGFEIRDQIMWVYGSGFPKSLDVSKAIDKTGGQSVAWFGPWFRAWREGKGILQNEVAALFPSKTGGRTGCVANWELGFNMPTPEQFNLLRSRYQLPFESLEVLAREVIGQREKALLAFAPGQRNDRQPVTLDITSPATDAARQWKGWGTALKPAHEPICVARKPLAGTVAANVLAYGTGAVNIDGCRVGDTVETWPKSRSYAPGQIQPGGHGETQSTGDAPAGRWPANLIHDGSDEVVALFPDTGRSSLTPIAAEYKANNKNTVYGRGMGTPAHAGFSDLTDSAARFFYCAKASRSDRGEGNIHPTVKPTDLMRYLCRLVTPPGGLVLDPFTGSGSTGKAAVLEGFQFIGFELSAEYAAIAQARIDAAQRYYWGHTLDEAADQIIKGASHEHP